MNGLNIRVRKRLINATELGYESNSFSVWGFYDVLDIKEVHWKSYMAPAINASPELCVFSNEMQLKLINPNGDEEFFNAFTPKKDQINGAASFPFLNYNQHLVNDADFTNMPLLSIVLINFDKQAIAKSGLKKMISHLTRLLSDCFKLEVSKAKDTYLRYAVYPTIGFMDGAILCRSNSFSIVERAITFIRGQQAQPEYLTSSYLLPCILDNGKAEWYEAWKKNSDDEKTRLQIRPTLRPGVSLEQFQYEFAEEISNLGLEQYNFAKKMKENGQKVEPNFWATFGNSDIVAVPNVPASHLYEIYLEKKKMMQPPYNNRLSTNRAYIQVRLDPLGDKAPKIYEPGEVSDRVLEEEIKQRITCLEKPYTDFIPDNLKVTIRNMISFYFDITRSAHTFDVRAMLDSCLRALVESIERLDEPDYHDQSIMAYFHENYVESLYRLTEEFSSLITDFARADRHMLEAVLMKNPSVGSASKLILVYHFLLKRIVNAFGGSNKYTFMTTSNSISEIAADSLFTCFTPHKNTHEEHVIFILRIAEPRLFFTAHTLLKIAHEAFHTVGFRDRDLRSKKMIEAMSIYISETYADAFWKLGCFINGIDLVKLEETLSGSREKLTKLLEDAYVHNKQELKNLVNNHLTEYIKNNPPYSNKFRHWHTCFLNALGAGFDIIKQKAIELEEDIYTLYLHAFRGFDSGNNNPGKPTEESKRFLMDSREYKDNYINNKLDIEKYSMIMFGFAFSRNIVTFPKMAHYLRETFNEAYCDMCSVELLGSSVEQYLAAHHPAGNETALPMGIPASFRLYSVLEVCYTKSRVEFTKDTDYMDSINSLLDDAILFQDTLSPVLEYLGSCLTVFKEDYAKNETGLQLLRDIYKAADPNSITNDPPELDAEVLWRLLEEWSLTSKW